MNSSVIMMFGSALIASISQLFLKISAKKKYDKWIYEYLNFKVIFGYFLLCTSLVINIIAYNNVPYKLGPIINASGYIFVIILSKLFLKEHISKRRLTGMIVIIAGIMVFNL